MFLILGISPAGVILYKIFCYMYENSKLHYGWFTQERRPQSREEEEVDNGTAGFVDLQSTKWVAPRGVPPELRAIHTASYLDNAYFLVLTRC